MAEKTNISWARSTFNPWIGCERISPACAHCYAESYARRTGKAHLWQGERYRTSAANWKHPLKWNAEAEKTGEQWRVFCASLADVFDNAVPHEWRADLFELIRETPALTWMLLTKRIGNAKTMLPSDWRDGYPNVWLGSTVVTQEEVDRDVPKLFATPARTRFLSIEPMLGPIDLEWPESSNPPQRCCDGYECSCRGGPANPPLVWGIDWVIVGGESGHNARPMDPRWARQIRDQCAASHVAFHFKQWGEWQPYGQGHAYMDKFSAVRVSTPDGGPADKNGWPMYHVGKLLAGRELDARTWDEFPEAR